MSYRVPVWARAFLGADRVLSRVASLREALRDELLLAWIRPEDRAAFCAAMYAPLSTYLPGGHRFEGGLFDWEERALEDPLFPRGGRILVGACGAGRELLALEKRGFHTFGFDPCDPFVKAAARVCDPRKSEVVQASYAELVASVNTASGFLFERLSTPPLDAIIFGWGSLSHVLPQGARLDLLRAVRTLAPKACVLLSFVMNANQDPCPEGKGRVRNAFRAVFRAMNAPGISEDGDRFFPEGGFFVSLREDEVRALALKAGYRIAWLKPFPYPHALLVPFQSNM